MAKCRRNGWFSGRISSRRDEPMVCAGGMRWSAIERGQHFRREFCLEETMACPKVVLCGKTVFLLSGYDKAKVKAALEKGERKLPDIIAVKELKQSASQNPDAVAFGYVAGKWMPAA